MSYLVLARKWRPQRFSDVVGQEHIVTTLSNAIRLGRVAHAYLFSGPRGVGKTTMARLLAKAMNCEQAPTTEPCGVCQSCIGITSGMDMDVIEIDGASNNGVEHIRDLRERVQYTAARGGYRVYIIDEVHMLSKEAWNALLKTLEEPPDKVIFIMATTSPDKVPNTITSRVQHFAFHRIPMALILGQLQQISQTDGLDVTSEALEALAAEAQGSMRDALSLFDQVIAGGGKDADAVSMLLGQISPQFITGFAEALITGNPGNGLQIVAELYRRGNDLEQAYKQILNYIRNVLVVKTVTDPTGLIDLPQERIEALQNVAKNVDHDQLLLLYRVMVEQGHEHFRNMPPRAALELLCLQGARVKGIMSIDELLTSVKSTHSTSTKPFASGTPGTTPPVTVHSRQVSATVTSIKPPTLNNIADKEASDSTPAMFEDMEGLPDNDYGKLIALLEQQGEFPLAMAVRACNMSALVKGTIRLELLDDEPSFLHLLEDKDNQSRLERDLTHITGQQVKLAVSMAAEPRISIIPTESAEERIRRIVQQFDGEIVKQ